MSELTLKEVVELLGCYKMLKLKEVVELLEYETMPYKKLIKWKRRLSGMQEKGPWLPNSSLIDNEICNIKDEVERRKIMKRKMIEEVLIPDLTNIVMGYLHSPRSYSITSRV